MNYCISLSIRKIQSNTILFLPSINLESLAHFSGVFFNAAFCIAHRGRIYYKGKL